MGAPRRAAAILAAALVWAPPQAFAAAYHYAGLTPVHRHGGQRAAISAAGCALPPAGADHVAAYVDVSNSAATAWGQAGWWRGASPFGVRYARPEAYWEVRTADGVYRWRAVGAARRGARYAVADTGLFLRRRAGAPLHLFRITVGAPGDAQTEFTHDAARDWNAGLAEVYASDGAAPPLGTAVFGHAGAGAVSLKDRGAWRRWTPSVDQAQHAQGAGYSARVIAPFSHWVVSYGGGRA